MLQLFTDSACDLPKSTFPEHDIHVLSLHVTIDGKESTLPVGDVPAHEALYRELAAGHLAQTAQVNVGEFMAAFKPAIQQGLPILYLGLDSVLSGTHQSALQAQALLLEDYPTADITILDSRCASGALGLMVLAVAAQRDRNIEPTAIAAWVRKHRAEFRHVVAIDDLKFLVAGGRLKKGAATFGTLLNIHPILSLQEDGKIILLQKIRTFKKSLKFLATQAIMGVAGNPAPTVIIASSADSVTTAALATLITDQCPDAQIMTVPIGAVLVSHVGPGCCAVFFRTHG